VQFMAHVIELPVNDGASIFVEIDDTLAQGNQRIAVDASERALEKITGNFEGALANIQRISNGLYGALSNLARVPDSATVEFGVKLTGGASVIIASGTAEANVKVTLNWKASGA
jgi:uncharacterized protein (DUF39 family)